MVQKATLLSNELPIWKNALDVVLMKRLARLLLFRLILSGYFS